MQQLITNITAVVGAVSALFTTLHVLFPNIAFFQRFGMAFRQLGPKQ